MSQDDVLLLDDAGDTIGTLEVSQQTKILEGDNSDVQLEEDQDHLSDLARSSNNQLSASALVCLVN